MKLLRYTFILFCLVFTSSLFAQEFQTKEMTRVTNDLKAIKEDVKDDNGELTAIVKVITNIDGLSFDCKLGFARAAVKDSPGEILLFVSPKEREIKIQKEGFLPKVIALPEPAESGAVYKVEVSTDLSATLASGRGTIVLTTIPEGAFVEIDGIGNSRKQTPAIYKDYEARPFKFKLSKDRYEAKDTIVKLVDQKSISVNLKLKPKWGKLKINVFPKSATIRIDGKVQGTGDLDLTNIEEALNIGSYDIEASLEGYHPQRQTVQITNNNISVIDFRLEPIKGFIKITSSPSNADVYLNDSLYGRTPLEKEVRIGRYQVVVRKEGFASSSVVANVIENEITSQSLTLNEKIDITIITEPKATITLNGTLLSGKTPLLAKANPGINHIIIEKEGYERLERDFSIRENQTEYKFDLELKSQATYISTSPSGVYAYISGKEESLVTPGQVYLKKGDYDITLTSPGYMSKKTTLSVGDKGDNYFYRLRPSSVMFLGLSTSDGGIGGNLTTWSGHFTFVMDIQSIEQRDDDPYPAPEKQSGLQMMIAMGVRINRPIPLSFHVGYGFRGMGEAPTESSDTQLYDRQFYSPVIGATVPISFAGGSFWLYGQINYWFHTEIKDESSVNLVGGIGFKL